MVSVVVGGQYGSEGKGKVALAWADKMNASAVVRVGGPNSGHTVYRNGEKYALRMLEIGRKISYYDDSMEGIKPVEGQK